MRHADACSAVRATATSFVAPRGFPPSSPPSSPPPYFNVRIPKALRIPRGEYDIVVRYPTAYNSKILPRTPGATPPSTCVTQMPHVPHRCRYCSPQSTRGDNRLCSTLALPPSSPPSSPPPHLHGRIIKVFGIPRRGYDIVVRCPTAYNSRILPRLAQPV